MTLDEIKALRNEPWREELRKSMPAKDRSAIERVKMPELTPEYRVTTFTEEVQQGLTAEMAEALLCRAYSHFILVNMFAQAYSKETAATDPGITYMLQPEQGLNPKYKRNTVAEVYDFIDKDLQAALPYVSDGYYTVPKYHFNKKAAEFAISKMKRKNSAGKLDGIEPCTKEQVKNLLLHRKTV